MGNPKERSRHLNNMLRACVLDPGGSWYEHFPLIEFAHNNSYHSSIRMAPHEALYGRKYLSPLRWDEVGEKYIVRPAMF